MLIYSHHALTPDEQNKSIKIDITQLWRIDNSLVKEEFKKILLLILRV